MAYHHEGISELLYALAQRNLVYNYNFLFFSNQIGSEVNHPDGWIYEDKGNEGKIILENNQCKIFTSGSNTQMTFKQALHEFPRWQTVLIGKTVTAEAVMELSSGCQVTMSLSDGVNEVTQTITASLQEQYQFELRLEIDERATGLIVNIQSQTNNGFLSIQKVFANLGQIALETLPCMVQGVIGQTQHYIATPNAPAEELSLCNEARELTANETRLNSVLNGRFGKGADYSMLPDLRGLFGRAWDNGRGVDPDAASRTMLGNPFEKGDLVGTYEADLFRSHIHDLQFKPVSILTGDKTALAGLDQGSSSQTLSSGGDETRPKNFSELYTIKWA